VLIDPAIEPLRSVSREKVRPPHSAGVCFSTKVVELIAMYRILDPTKERAPWWEWCYIDHMSHDSVGRIATWFCVALLIVLSLMPGAARPHTSLAGQWEHLIAYAGAGIIATLSYRRPMWVVIGLGVLGCSLELLQNLVPGRSPAVLDAIFSTAGGGAGAGSGALLMMLVLRGR
jgi:hypothetical protein